MRYLVYKQLLIAFTALFIFIGCSDSGSDDQTSGNPETPVSDTQAPAAIELHAQTIDTRLPAVELTWKAVGDDGSVGTADHYDIRFARAPITETSWESSCKAADITYTLPPAAPAASGQDEHFEIKGPDEKAVTDPCRFITLASTGSYYFAVRAVDEAGNISPLDPQSVVSVDTLHTKTAEIIIGDDFKNDVLGGSAFSDFITTAGTLVGDVDGDGLEDLLFGSYLLDGACLVYGTEIPISVTLHQQCDDENNVTGDGCDLPTKSEGLRYTCLSDSKNILAGMSKFASGLKGLGDINGDGFDDFGISGELDDHGFVAVYLGRADGLTLDLPNIIIKNIAGSASGNYFSFCEAGNFTSRRSPGDLPIDAFAVGEPGLDTLHVIDGNASWTAATQLTIELNNTTTSDAILTIKSADAVATDLGYLCASTKPLLGPNPGLLFLSRDAHQVILMEGQTISGHETLYLHLDLDDVNSSCLDPKVVRFITNLSLSTSADFGNYFLGEHDVNGDGMAEVIITQPQASLDNGGNGLAVQIFDGSQLASEIGADPIYLTPQGTPIGNAWYCDRGWVMDASLNPMFRDNIALLEWDWPSHATHTMDLVSINEDDLSIHLDQEHDDGSITPGLYPYEDIKVATPMHSGWVKAGTFERTDRPTIIYGTITGRIGLIH